MSKILKYIVVALLILNTTVVFAVNRMIIQCQPVATSKVNAGKVVALELNKPLSVSMLQQISTLAGARASEIGRVGVGGHIVKLNKDISQDKFAKLVKTLEAKPNVKYVEEDKIVKSMATVPSAKHK